MILCFSFVVLVSTLQFFLVDIASFVSEFERGQVGKISSQQLEQISKSRGIGDCQAIRYKRMACFSDSEITAKESQNQNNIVVPVLIVEDGAVIGYFPNRHQESLRLQDFPDLMDAITLRTFFETYASRFANIIFDVRWVAGSQRAGVRQMLGLAWDSKRHKVISPSCEFVRLFQKELGVDSACSSQGILGSWLLGFSFWTSVSTAISSFQLDQIQRFELPSLVFYEESNASGAELCALRAKWVVEGRDWESIASSCESP